MIQDIEIEFKPRDWWIGVVWRAGEHGALTSLDVWIAVMPMFPIHLTFVRYT